MGKLRYEELKEIRRGFGILFILVLTYLGDLLKEYVKNPNPNPKESFLLFGTSLFLLTLFIGLSLITVVIWRKGENKNG